MAFVSHKSDFTETLELYPLLKPPKALFFNDSNFEDKSEELSRVLVKLQDKELSTESKEYNKIHFPVLSLEGLDKTEVTKFLIGSDTFSGFS